MKVVLLGSRGQLGIDLAKTRPPEIDLVPLTHDMLDITRKEEVRRILHKIRPDLVIHTAAFVNVDNAEDHAVETFHVNAIATRDIAQVCQEMQAKLLYISSNFVFDGKKNKAPYDEGDSPNPINTYGVSKYVGEIFVRNLVERHYVIRSSGLFGQVGSVAKSGNFVLTILKKAKNQETLKVVNDIWMSPTYTRDAAREIWKLILEQKEYGIYHITNSGSCSWHDLALKILEFAGLRVPIFPISHTEYPAKAKRPAWTVLGSRKGIRLRTWEAALEEFIKNEI